MRELELHRTSEFLRIVFQVLWNNPNGLPAREVLEAVAAKCRLAEAEKSVVPPAALPEYERLVRSAANTLAEVGWLVKTKERWYLSDEGRAVCRNTPNAAEIYQTALRLAEEQRKLREVVALAAEEAEEKAWQQVWRYLNEMNPIEFKYLVGELLKAMDYNLDWVSPPGKSRGYIDLIAYPKPFGQPGARTKIHLRQKGQAATLEGLQSFLGVLAPNDLGIFISTGGFTEQVLEEARLAELHQIRLLTLEDFFQLWVQHYARLSTEARQRFPITPIYFLTPGR